MVEEIGSDQASYVTADVSNVNDVKNYIDKTLSFKKIDITLLNAGIEGKIASIEKTDGDFDKVLAVNVQGFGSELFMWFWLKMAVVSCYYSSTAGIRASQFVS